MGNLPQNAGRREGLQTTPLPQVGRQFNHRNGGGPGWRVHVAYCPCRRGSGAQGNARPQARMAGVQPPRLLSGANRWAEPPWQHCPAAGSYRRVASVRLALPRAPQTTRTFPSPIAKWLIARPLLAAETCTHGVCTSADSKGLKIEPTPPVAHFMSI